MYYSYIISFSTSCLLMLSTAITLPACDSPITASSNYVSLNAFVGTQLPDALFTIWIPIHKGSTYTHNSAKKIALQSAEMKDKSSRISQELYNTLQEYITRLKHDLTDLQTHYLVLTKHPTDRETILTQRNNKQRCEKRIAAYTKAIEILNTVRCPDEHAPVGGSPIIRRFSHGF